MDYRMMTTTETLREHEERLSDAARARLAIEAVHRIRIRRKLRSAILQMLRLDGDSRELAAELAGLARRAERRLSGRACC